MAKFVLTLVLMISAHSAVAEVLPFSDFQGRIFKNTQSLSISAGVAFFTEHFENCRVLASNKSCTANTQPPTPGTVCKAYEYPAGSLFVVNQAPVLTTSREGLFKFKATTAISFSLLTEDGSQDTDLILSCETQHFSNDDALLDGMRPRIVMRFLEPLFKEQPSALNPWLIQENQ